MESSEWASPAAVELLDELVVIADECTAVLVFLSEEADLYLDELSMVVEGLREYSTEALKAASLLNVRAPLSESWATGRSRPRGILARHSEAVKRGAVRVKPSLPVRGSREGTLESTLDESQNWTGERPGCEAVAKSTGRPCSNSAIYVGGGQFAAHCYGHLDEAERNRYSEHQDRVAEDQRRRRSDEVDRLVADGRMVASDWLDRRRGRDS